MDGGGGGKGGAKEGKDNIKKRPFAFLKLLFALRTTLCFGFSELSQCNDRVIQDLTNSLFNSAASRELFPVLRWSLI